MKEIRLGENERLRMLTREMGDLLAKEILAVCDELPASRREAVVKELLGTMTRAAAQIFMTDLMAAVRRRSADNSAMGRVLSGVR